MSAASAWPDARALALLGVELPVVQAPMAGFAFGELAVAVAKAGGLGSLACASLSPERLRTEWGAIRKATSRPINLNFFCHAPPPSEPEREAAWQARLAPYFAELGLDASVPRTSPGRAPFDETTCDLVCELAPEIVSFHFGLPDEALVARLRKVGVKLLSSATTVAEARWLEDHGCDGIIAQGFEAGGHRGSFLSTDRAAVHGEARARVPGVATQLGTFALVPQVVDAVARARHRRGRHRRPRAASSRQMSLDGLPPPCRSARRTSRAPRRRRPRSTAPPSPRRPPTAPRSRTCSRAGRRAAS